MMEQYDKQEAVRFMLKNMDDSAFKPLSGRAEALFAQAVEADIAYMRSAGVIDEEGMSGQAYYDDDDAFGVFAGCPQVEGHAQQGRGDVGRLHR